MGIVSGMWDMKVSWELGEVCVKYGGRWEFWE